MHVSEFDKQPRGGYEIDCYVHPKPIASPLGNFSVELQMDIDETAPPADEMVAVASHLVEQFEKDKERLANMVYKEYLRVCNDGRWMEICDVESGLSQSDFVRYLDGRTLAVSHDSENPGEPYSARVSISPEWDEEHGLYYMYDGKDWTLTDC